jgi:hypothetical protein
LSQIPLLRDANAVRMSGSNGVKRGLTTGTAQAFRAVVLTRLYLDTRICATCRRLPFGPGLKPNEQR